jgi:hypothetical protein
LWESCSCLVNHASLIGIFGKSKDSIPDFSQQQLDTYKAKLSITDADNHGIAQKLSYEDIEAILHFLSYKKIRK